jgi:YD repeat-containing protein
MLRSVTTFRQSMPLVAGAIFGLAISWWTSVNAAAFLPALSLTSLTNGQTISGVVSLSASADAAGLSSVQFVVSGQNIGNAITSGSCATSWDTRQMANGSHTVTAVGADSIGATVWAAPITVTVQNAAPADTTAPSVSVAAPVNGALISGTFALVANASDNVGVTGVWFTVDSTNVGSEDAAVPYQTAWNTATISNGAHVVRALARDAAGNVTTSAAVTVTVSNASVDTTAPTVAVTGPASGATVGGNVTVTANAADNIGVTSVQFTLDGIDLGSAVTSAPFSAPWNTTGAANGTHQLRAVARDAAGNTSISSAVSVTVNNTSADATGPLVNITSPSPMASVTGSVTLAASASDNVAVTSVQFTVDGVNVGSADTSSPYSTSWSSTSVANGSHVVRAVARDAAGNTTTSAGVTISVSNSSTDTTRPTISLSSPASGATVSGTVSISASASDNVAVVRVQFNVDGVDYGAADLSSPWAVSWNTTAVTNGSHTLRATAYDAAGNSRTTTSRTVTVSNIAADTIAPTVGVTSPANGAIVGGTVTLAASASDNIGVSSVRFTLDGVTIGQDSSAPYTMAWSTTTVVDGPKQVLAIARDAAGNESSAAVLLAVDNTVGSGVPGDMNGDGRPDLVFVHSTGQLYSWFMNGGTLIGEGLLSPTHVPNGWAVATINDFTGDGQSDVLLQETQTGQLELWVMDGLVKTAEIALSTDSTPWRVIGSADFNADRKADLIWQQPATGQIYVWLMNGVQFMSQGTVNPNQLGLAWKLVGTADFNGDRGEDLLWQSAQTGELVVWMMNGLTLLESRRLTPESSGKNWVVRSVADFDLDGRMDLIFQNTSSAQLYMWNMVGTTIVSDGFLTPSKVGASWTVVGGR